MPNRSKNLGSAFERRLVKKAQCHGVPATKQPLSGILKEHPSDVLLEPADMKVLAECKVRSEAVDAKGNRYVRLDTDWLKHVMDLASSNGFNGGVLVFNAKGSSRPLVLLDLDFFLRLLPKSDTKS